MNNIFKQSAVSIFKIILAVVLIYATALIFTQKDMWGVIFGLCLLVFITLPTVFVVYFKNNFIAKHPGFAKPWKILRIIYAIILILFLILVCFMIARVYEVSKTQKAIEFINSKQVTLDDALGANLPPEPDQKLNDATVAGIDANNNYIRDDVELAIFKKYLNSAKIRAAELQYAQALQLELTQVFNSETLVAVMQKESHGINCIGQTGPEEINQASFKIINDRKKEVEESVLNTGLRKQKQSDVYKKYMTGYASLPGNECDIELSSLPN